MAQAGRFQPRAVLELVTGSVVRLSKLAVSVARQAPVGPCHCLAGPAVHLQALAGRQRSLAVPRRLVIPLVARLRQPVAQVLVHPPVAR
jgi:hypothetical protein